MSLTLRFFIAFFLCGSVLALGSFWATRVGIEQGFTQYLKKSDRDFLNRLSVVGGEGETLYPQPWTPSTNVWTQPPFLIPLMIENGEIEGLPEIVGFVALPKGADSPLGQMFLTNQKRLLYTVLFVGIFISAFAAWWLARYFRAPIAQLAAATHQVAGRNYTVRLPPRNTNDELGRVVQDFNFMVTTLERHEHAQKLWITETSHELRTPLAVLRARLEALRDGFLQPTPEVLGTTLSAVEDLGHTVDNLYELSRLDMAVRENHPENIDILVFLNELEQEFLPSFQLKNLAFSTSASPKNFGEKLFLDRRALRQILTNLLTNSLRYTDAGGRVHLSVELQPNAVVFTCNDTFPGVSTENLERLFDRFYRVEPSRSRQYGGSGLGLALCRALAESQGGTVQATASAWGGLCVSVTIPHQVKP